MTDSDSDESENMGSPSAEISAQFQAALARENLQRMWWLLLTSTCLSILLTVFNSQVSEDPRLYPWSVFDLGGSVIFFGIFCWAKTGKAGPKLLWWLGPSYFVFWLTLMLGYYTTGLRNFGETATFIIGAITPAVLILLPFHFVAVLLLGYFAAFCVILLGPWSEGRGANAIAASFLNGSLGVIVAFLAAWFLYRARRLNFESETLIRKKAEQARLGEHTVRAILENMPFLAWLKSVDGKFLAVNQAYADSLGKKQDDIVSKSVEELFDREIADEFRLQDEFVVKRREGFHTERIDTRGGEPRWHEVFKYPVFADDGNIAAIAGLSVDITDRKMLAESLISADRAKSEFLAMMSHEIRTPMTSVLGYAELLRDEINSPKASDYLECIRENGHLLLGIVNDLLDLSKIEVGQFELSPSTFNTAPLLDRIFRRFRDQAERKGLELAMKIDSSADSSFVADARRFEQVIGNLISNAIKFTQQGRISISLSADRVSDQQSLLKCIVRDTGIGISQAGQERLFKPFTQIDSSIGRKYEGSGLGLVISRTLCRKMGGDLIMESKEGAGSTFIATILVSHADDFLGRQNDSTISEEALKGLRVLVVEDNPTNRRLLASILTKWGVRVTLTESGEIALSEFQKSNFDVVLMDVQMPGMDGFETTRRLRNMEAADNKRKRTRIIAITAFAMIGDKQRCLDAGMDGYIGKPLRFPELRSALAGN